VRKELEMKWKEELMALFQVLWAFLEGSTKSLRVIGLQGDI
jgi:hypothetical protein